MFRIVGIKGSKAVHYTFKLSALAAMCAKSLAAQGYQIEEIYTSVTDREFVERA